MTTITAIIALMTICSLALNIVTVAILAEVLFKQKKTDSRR